MQYIFIYKYIGYILLKFMKQHSLTTSKNISLWQEIHLPSQQYFLSLSFHDSNFRAWDENRYLTHHIKLRARDLKLV